jgi:hypothetical protein
MRTQILTAPATRRRPLTWNQLLDATDRAEERAQVLKLRYRLPRAARLDVDFIIGQLQPALVRAGRRQLIEE